MGQPLGPKVKALSFNIRPEKWVLQIALFVIYVHINRLNFEIMPIMILFY